MSRHTPLVANGCLRTSSFPEPIALDSPAWYAWLDDADHCSFHFHSAAGDFTARRERKQRGTTYWIAYRQADNRLYKRYLGKTETLTQAHLITVATALAVACSSHMNISDP